MNTERPTRYIRQNQEQTILSHKWGFKDHTANHSLELSRRALIRLLTNPIAWEYFNVSQADYFLSVLEFEAGWKQGYFNTAKDFWGKNTETMVENKKADGQAYYEKARVYLNTLINPEKTDIFTPPTKGEEK